MKRTSVRVPTSHHKCKTGLGEPTDKAYPSTRDRGWGALAVLFRQEQTKPNRYHSAQYMHKDAQDCFFFLSSFSKEGCTRACMGQLERNRPCALCHYNSGGEASVVPFQAPLLTLHSCAGRGQRTCQPGNALTGTSKARLPPYARHYERKMPFVTPEE